MRELLEELLVSVLEWLGQAWWVEIQTHRPRCLYYFGPFLSAQNAQKAEAGYREDLEQEGAEGITVIVKRCQPSILTLETEETQDYLAPLNPPRFT